ncbi:prostasin-like [Gigantopelta aegis]|uniref:prostasin-like n=1 Tax=Gigantopelta aegis TaxID=1735272 RepID=UPI001B88D4A5|nr:prostasin-like [Gigantopelta aegis]
MCEFPWMVYLFRDPSPCGASIIDSRHLVTAAHCVHNIKKNQLRIVIGEHRRSVWVQSAEYEVYNYRVFVHPQYVPKYYTETGTANDIAIIKLSQEINWSRYKCLKPICLPESWRRFRSTTCTVTGWGIVSPVINFLRPPLADVLQKVTVDIVEDRVCANIFTRDWFKSTNYCAGYLQGGRDSCGGDSGGPLQCRVNGKWILAGLVSTGSGCGERGKAAIYTDVAKYRTFIDQIRRIY